MRWGEGRLGRIFVIRLEDGDAMPSSVEKFCVSRGIARGVCFFIGGAKEGSLVAGPASNGGGGLEVLLSELPGISEMCGIGTVFPDGSGRPSLHMHASAGRGGESATGCIRPGVSIWKLGEVILIEIEGSAAERKYDEELGLSFLEP